MTPMVRKNFEDDPSLRALWEKENMVTHPYLLWSYRGLLTKNCSSSVVFLSLLNIEVQHCFV